MISVVHYSNKLIFVLSIDRPLVKYGLKQCVMANKYVSLLYFIYTNVLPWFLNVYTLEKKTFKSKNLTRTSYTDYKQRHIIISQSECSKRSCCDNWRCPVCCPQHFAAIKCTLSQSNSQYATIWTSYTEMAF